MNKRERIKRKIKVLDNGCWQWVAGKSSTGYGYIKVDGVQIGAHVYSYLVFKGSVPKGKLVRHTCDNRWCVRPAHLLLGTHKDNVHDAIVRKRRGMTTAIALKISLALSGRPAHNKGKSPSAATRRKISKANKGKSRTIAQRKNYTAAAVARELNIVRHKDSSGRFNGGFNHV